MIIVKKPIIGIIGSSQPSQEVALLAEEVGRLLAHRGATVISGGLGGIMEAVSRGVKRGEGLTIGILPGVSSKEANPYIDISIPTGMGEARNLIIVRSSHVLIAIGGGYGTLSEIAFALKLNVPVVGLKTWELEKISKESINIIPAKDAQDAVEKAMELI